MGFSVQDSSSSSTSSSGAGVGPARVLTLHWNTPNDRHRRSDAVFSKNILLFEGLRRTALECAKTVTGGCRWPAGHSGMQRAGSLPVRFFSDSGWRKNKTIRKYPWKSGLDTVSSVKGLLKSFRVGFTGDFVAPPRGPKLRGTVEWSSSYQLEYYYII